MGCATCKPVVAKTVVQTVVEDFTKSDFHDNYILGLKLGRGAYAQVRVATPVGKRRDSDGEDKAVKILDLLDKKNEENDQSKIDSYLLKRARLEASLWWRAKNHKHVLHLQEMFIDARLAYFVMEKCAYGLFQFMERMSELNERSVGNIVEQMLQGVAHVHSIGIVHRDIKADNFLVGGKNRSTIKLSDFGLAARLSANGMLTGHYGTAPYMSPEMVTGQLYGVKTDVWSMGVLAYTLLFGSFPYSPTPKVKNSEAMRAAIVQGKPPTFQPTFPSMEQMRSESVVEFAESLLERDPAKRPCANDALKLPYMVAVSRNQHMLDCELPSLRPMLYSAKKEGAFEVRDLNRELDIDGFLYDLQKERRGVVSPYSCSDIEKSFKQTDSAPGDNESSATTTASRNTSTLINSPTFSRTSSSSSQIPVTHIKGEK